MPIENREIKSGVFADLFEDDEKDGKKNFLALYNAILPAKARYKESLYKIPAPELYVFYNGEKQAEKECILKLSDAFLERQDLPMCEAKVKFTNIRGKEGENLPVVQKCDILKQYCEFMEIVFRHQAELKEQPTNEEMQGNYRNLLCRA